MLIGRENLEKWVVARAFAIAPPDINTRNKYRATCKICGKVLNKGEGEQVTLAGVRYHVQGTAYVCQEDAAYIRRCKEGFP